MTVGILSVGTEVTRGEIVDTNSAFLAAALTDAGFDVGGGSAVADDVEKIAATLKRMAAEHEVIVVTGGLGPTTDDLTARAAALAAGVKQTRARAPCSRFGAESRRVVAP